MAAFSDFAALARAVCSTPIGLLALVGEDVAWCAGSGDTERLVVLSQSASAETKDGFFESRAQSMYCAGVVLLTAQAEDLGRLCVLNDQSGPALTEEQRELLRTLGKRVVEHIESCRTLRWRALGHLAGGIAHDMNNALQTIVGALSTVEKLIETDDLERIARFIAAGRRSAQRGGELTRSLQRLARRKPDGVQPVELNSLLVSMEDLFRRVCGERATLQLQLSERAATVTCDPGELESVLLGFAIDAVQTIVDTGELTISTDEARVIFRMEERNEIRAAYQWTGAPA
jgi:C4-dicarboxylate-specific signal transduction histidine kinase